MEITTTFLLCKKEILSFSVLILGRYSRSIWLPLLEQAYAQLEDLTLAVDQLSLDSLSNDE
jgi:hypothetical protein